MNSTPAEVPTDEIIVSQINETPISVTPTSVTPTSVTPTSVTPTSVTPTSVTPTSVTPISATPKKMEINLTDFIEKRLNPKCPPCDKATTGRYIYSVFHSIMALVAIYLAFRCNNGFKLGSFLIACTCPYIYIIYIVATKGTCGIIENNKLI
jgi:hypothetical protein